MAIKKCIIANDQPIQLLNKASYPATQTINGVTFTNNGDGSYTVNGTATDNSNLYISRTIICEPNKKYLLSGCPAGGSWSAFNIYVTQANDSGWLSDTADNGGGVIFTSLSNANKFSSVVLRISINQTVNITFKPQLVALTETFGTGNEPATVSAYKAKFPNDVYPYNLSNIANSYKRIIKVADVCQLLDSSKFIGTVGTPTTNNGITVTKNADGTYTVDGTATAQTFFNIFNFDPKIGNKDRSCVWMNSVSNGLWGINCGYDDGNGWCFFRFFAGDTYDNQILRPQLIDLWETFGKTNAPTTVEAAKAKLPADSYPYAAKCFVHTYEDRTIVKADGSYV